MIGKQRKNLLSVRDEASIPFGKQKEKSAKFFYDDLHLLCYLLLFYFMMFACLTLKSTLCVHCSHNKVYSMDTGLAATCYKASIDQNQVVNILK